MTDWDRVEELRSKGWDWDRIAEDPKAGFRTEAGITDPGRALRTLYFQRRSRRPKSPSKEPTPEASGTSKRKWNLARIGMMLTPLFAVWFLLAYFIPSPVGVYVTAIPTLGLLLAVAAFILAFGLLRTSERWNAAMRNAVATGVIVGLVFAGGFGLAALSAGCPTLSGATSGAPDGFSVTTASAWQDSGVPVFFFLGSTACPYCSASSWAFVLALDNFGSLTGITFASSSSTDVYPNTPEEVLAGTTYSGTHIAFQVAESTDSNTITIPPFGNCVQQAFFSAFDKTSGVPFIVVGGKYFDVGPIVDPGQLRVPPGQSGNPLTPMEMQQQIGAHSGQGWDAVWPGADWLTAYLLKVDGGSPSSLLSNTTISQDYASIPS